MVEVFTKRPAPAKPAAKSVPVAEPLSTTGLDDMVALGRAIIDLCHTAQFDDMTCGEIEQAFGYASHLIKLEFQEYGTLDAKPGT